MSDIITPQEQRYANIERATSTILENATHIFLPLEDVKNTNLAKEFAKNNNVYTEQAENSLYNYTLEIQNRILTQNHKDILDLIMCHKKVFITKDNSFFVDISRYEFLKKLNKAPTAYKWLEEKIMEIAGCRIAIKSPDGDVFNFGIIDKYLIKKVETQAGRNKPNSFIRIKFSSAFLSFWEVNKLLDYKKFVPDLIALKSPFLKAMARFLISNKNHKIYLNSYLKSNKKVFSASKIKEIKRQIKNIENETDLLNANILKKFGITIRFIADKQDFLLEITRNTEIKILNTESTHQLKFHQHSFQLD